MDEAKRTTYDPLCGVIADQFLADIPAATKADREELAQCIQDAVEDYLRKFTRD